MMEHDVRVAGGTGDIETRQLLVIQRCLCPIVLCNYKRLNISLSKIGLPVLLTYDISWNEILHADGGLTLTPIA